MDHGFRLRDRQHARGRNPCPVLQLDVSKFARDPADGWWFSVWRRCGSRDQCRLAHCMPGIDPVACARSAWSCDHRHGDSRRTHWTVFWETQITPPVAFSRHCSHKFASDFVAWASMYSGEDAGGPDRSREEHPSRRRCAVSDRESDWEHADLFVIDTWAFWPRAKNAGEDDRNERSDPHCDLDIYRYLHPDVLRHFSTGGAGGRRAGRDFNGLGALTAAE